MDEKRDPYFWFVFYTAHIWSIGCGRGILFSGCLWFSHSMIPSFQVCFYSIAWEWIHGIRSNKMTLKGWRVVKPQHNQSINRSNFAYALTLTRSRAGFLRDYFCKFTTQLWPLIMGRIWFPLQLMLIWSNFAYVLTWSRSRLGLLCIHFCKFTTVMALGYHQNFVSTQYLLN